MLSSGCPSSTRRWFGFQPNTKAATLVFGFFHGFGLSIKIIKYEISTNGLVTNLLAFNVGGEIGQLLAMGAILIVMGFWRRTAGFLRHAYTANGDMIGVSLLQSAGLYKRAGCQFKSKFPILPKNANSLFLH